MFAASFYWSGKVLLVLQWMNKQHLTKKQNKGINLLNLNLCTKDTRYKVNTFAPFWFQEQNMYKKSIDLGIHYAIFNTSRSKFGAIRQFSTCEEWMRAIKTKNFFCQLTQSRFQTLKSRLWGVSYVPSLLSLSSYILQWLV